jgi:DNA excision repair protein ERCC-2
MPEITVGVRELLALKYGPRNISLTPHPAVLGQGIQGHKEAAANRPAEYQREVPIESGWVEGSWRLRVRGRIDGLLDTGEYILVEEIKTTRAPDPRQLLPEHNEFYRAQVTLYAYFVAQDNPDRDVRARLTWWHLETKEETIIELTAEEIASGEGLFRQLAIEYIRREKTRWQRLEQRNNSLAAMHFPFPSYRPGQEELVQTTALALEHGQDMMVEAATGIGKTAALLLPAISWLRTAPADAKVFFLTAKTSGRDIVIETLKLWPDIDLVTVCLEAKERWCTHPDGDCDSCPLARDFYPKAAQLLPKMLAAKILTPDLIYQFAGIEGICPFELALEAATHADMVIADYNYVFDPMVQLQRFFGGNKIPAVLLIDEAHNLVSRGREMFSASLGKRQVLHLQRELKLVQPELSARLKELNSLLIQWNKEMKAEGTRQLLLDKLPRGLPAKLSRLAEELALAEYSSPEFKDFCRALIRFNKIVQRLGQEHAIYLERQGGDTFLNLFCINPGPLLQKQRQKCTAVFFSATLSPGSYYRELLGCRDEYLDLSLPSPFPKENRLFVHIPGIKTTYAARASYYPAVARYIAKVIQQQPGNYIAYLPSYAFLREVAASLEYELPGGYRLHLQRSGMDMEEREELMQGLTGPGANIGLAVMGGLFGEGVDMPGEMLIGTIIVGPGLPMVSPQQELIRRYFAERNDNGFLYAYLIPGMLRVIQSAGRVFRTPADKGLVVLLDDRFRQEGYRQLLPQYWQDEGLFSNNWLQRIRKFWAKNTGEA